MLMTNETSILGKNYEARKSWITGVTGIVGSICWIIFIKYKLGYLGID